MARRITLDYLKTETASGVILASAALAAILLANSPWAASYFGFIDHQITVQIGAFVETKSVLKWVKDGLMAVFFFVVGLEIKYEILRGELSNPRRLALPDHVGAAMRLLCCGINPSVHAAEAGVGYVTRSNRFWPALLASGLADVDRDPRLLLRRHRIGMTDLVPRPTPRASDLDPAEYGPSLDRLARLCGWLRPAAVVVVGIDAWRRASGDRRAVLGWQPEPVGPTPVYVMPSTSGLNARVPLADLVDHLRAAAGPPPT